MRVQNYPAAIKAAADDFFIIDGETNGTRALPASAKADKAKIGGMTIYASDWLPIEEDEETVGGPTGFYNVLTFEEYLGVTSTSLIKLGLAGSQDLDTVTKCAQAFIYSYVHRDNQVVLIAQNKPTIDLPIVYTIGG